MLRKLLTISILAVALFATQRFCRKQTDTFAVSKICSSLPFHPQWEVSPLQQDEQKGLKAILAQPYFYLAKGAQCYVFLSQDGRYVIKFFRLNHLLPPFWTHFYFPYPLQPLRIAKIQQKQEELDKDFLSYKIAYEEMREETGLVFLHLNKTDSLHQQLTIFDRLHISHILDLDQMEFLVQKKADLVYPALEQIVETKGAECAKQALSRLVDLLTLRSSKGIFDKDPDLNTNFGFIEEKPIQIDVGRYRKQGEPQKIDRNEIIRITDHLNQWLRVHYPPLAEHLDAQTTQIP
jgi:hypothetical protein